MAGAVAAMAEVKATAANAVTEVVEVTEVTAASPVTAVVGVTATVIMNPAVEVAITEVATAAVGAGTELNRWLGADRRMKAVLSR